MRFCCVTFCWLGVCHSAVISTAYISAKRSSAYCHSAVCHLARHHYAVISPKHISVRHSYEKCYSAVCLSVEHHSAVINLSLYLFIYLYIIYLCSAKWHFANCHSVIISPRHISAKCSSTECYLSEWGGARVSFWCYFFLVLDLYLKSDILLNVIQLSGIMLHFSIVLFY